MSRGICLAWGAGLLALGGILAHAAGDEPAAQPEAEKPGTEVKVASPSPEKFLLAFKFQPNRVVRYEVSDRGEMTTHDGDVTETASDASESKRNYKVVGVGEDGVGEVEVMIDWIRMSATFRDKDSPKRAATKFEFQSDDPAKQPEQFQRLRKAVGKPLARLRINPAGKALGVTRLPGAPDLNSPDMKGTAGGSTPDDFLYWMPLPPQPVAVGETWKDRFDVVVHNEDQLQVKVALQNIYVLSAVEGEKATIEFRTVVLTPGVEPFISAQLVQREKSGKAVFDLKQGLLLSREVHVDGTVNGFHGARSSVRAKRTYRERLLTDEASASRDAQSGIETGVSVSKQ